MTRSAAFLWALAVIFVLLAIFAAVRPDLNDQATSRLIARLFPGLSPFGIDTTDFWFRKGLHFLAYGLFGAVVASALRQSGTRRVFWFALGIALAVAALDESLQAVFNYRAGRICDVGIDLAGAFLGVAFLGGSPGPTGGRHNHRE